MSWVLVVCRFIAVSFELINDPSRLLQYSTISVDLSLVMMLLGRPVPAVWY